MKALLRTLPFALSVLSAQTPPSAPPVSYDAVAIHKSPPGSEHRPAPGMEPGPQGGLRTHDTPAATLIAWAYGVQTYQIIGAPGWASNQGYNITFTPDEAEPPAAVPSGPKSNLSERAMDRDLIRLQGVLRDRFGLILRSETQELPVYKLVQATDGAKLTPHAAGGNSNLRVRNGQITGTGTTMERLADVLSGLLERPVRDETRLTGQFDFKVTPDSEGPMTESVFTHCRSSSG